MTATDQVPAVITERASSVDQACRLRPESEPLIRSYFAHVPEEDRPRDPQDVLDVVDRHLRVARHRKPGIATLRIFNSSATAEGTGGWAATSTMIDIVNDDMPYVVESVVSAITAAGVTVHRVLHPILAVRRDHDGTLVSVAGESRRGLDPQDCIPESWVHILIDRLSDAERAEAIEASLHDALEAVRAVVTDSAALIGAAAVVATELRTSFSPRSTQEVSEATDFLYWLTAGNLTFLGYRCDESAPEGDGHVIHPVPGTGLGILRDGLPSAGDFDEEWVNADCRRRPPRAHPDVQRHRVEPRGAAVLRRCPHPGPGRTHRPTASLPRRPHPACPQRRDHRDPGATPDGGRGAGFTRRRARFVHRPAGHGVAGHLSASRIVLGVTGTRAGHHERGAAAVQPTTAAGLSATRSVRPVHVGAGLPAS